MSDRMIKLQTMDVEKRHYGDIEISIPEYLPSEYLSIEDQEALIAFLQENIREWRGKTISRK